MKSMKFGARSGYRMSVEPRFPVTTTENTNGARPITRTVAGRTVRAVVKLSVALVPLAFAGCPGPRSPRPAELRAAITLAAHATRAASDACASEVDRQRIAAEALPEPGRTARLSLARDLGAGCSAASHGAAAALEAGEAALDAANASSALCSAARGVEGLRAVVAHMTAARVAPPASVPHALEVGGAIAALAAGRCASAVDAGAAG